LNDEKSPKVTINRKLLSYIAQKTDLKEGPEGVRAILREIYRAAPISTKKLARAVGLPIPVAAAVRNELEETNVVKRTSHGTILTSFGKKFVKETLEVQSSLQLRCSTCEGLGLELPTEAQGFRRKMEEFTAQRPVPLTKFDQAFGKPITALRRAYYLLEKGDLEGKSILLLGDDDFTSLGICLVNDKAKITVVDIDSRLLSVINSIAKEHSFSIKCQETDLRKELPRDLKNSFDVVMLDPPYTIAGLRLFLSRAIQAIKKTPGKSIYLSYVHRPPDELVEVHSEIIAHGLAVEELIPKFNLYEGAEMHANTTFMARLTTASATIGLITKDFEEKIYTGQVQPTIRHYRCKAGHIIPVGQTEEIKTIEELKQIGCPECGSKDYFKRVAREKIDL
jgi:hypothetical protein